jgi:hypothetical protein
VVTLCSENPDDSLRRQLNRRGTNRVAAHMQDENRKRVVDDVWELSLLQTLDGFVAAPDSLSSASNSTVFRLKLLQLHPIAINFSFEIDPRLKGNYSLTSPNYLLQVREFLFVCVYVFI